VLNECVESFADDKRGEATWEEDYRDKRKDEAMCGKLLARARFRRFHSIGHK
jgi:hypothetical protein